jgi:circadian clock protein KaiC
VDSGLLKIHASRPTLHGLEMHLVVIYKLVKQFKPKAVVLDPITNLVTVSNLGEVRSFLMRLIDFLQKEQITVMFTALTFGDSFQSESTMEVSSLIDTWLSVHDIELNGERNRGIYIIKSRGMNNSNQVREFRITDNGIQIVELTLGPNGVLIGSAREEYNLQQKTGEILRKNALNLKDKQIESKKLILDSKIAKLQSEFELAREELNRIFIEEELRKEIIEKNRNEMISMRERKPLNNSKRKK